MRNLLTILSLVATVLTVGLRVHAADDITHFYGSAFFSMASGVDKDYAVSIAVGNEMIDRGIWTNPMGLPTPRLLYHFLGTPLEFTVNEGGLKRGLAIATIKHPLFYNLLHAGMMKKDPVKLGSALHLLTDTFFHAGYSNLLGHGEGGHRPDMPYEEVQKARQCFQAIIEINYMIRDMQGQSADLSIMKRIISEVVGNEVYAAQLKKVTGAENLDDLVRVVARRPDLFTQIMLDNTLVRNSFFTNIEKTDQYMKIAMIEIMDAFKLKGYSSIDSKSLQELMPQFKDVGARTDIDPMQTLKIIIFRILQLQDPVLSKDANRDLKNLGFNPDELRIFEKAHFDFSKLGGFAHRTAFQDNIENETRKNIDALRMLIANVQILKDQITLRKADGSSQVLQSHSWSQNAQTFAEHVFPEVLSWLRLFNQDGKIYLIEHRNVGDLVSTQTDTDWMRSLMDREPSYLENTIKLLKSIESNPETLALVARLRALAETSYLLANSATKDLFPGKLSPIKKVVYEDDSLPHACFAKECRVEATRNLVAEYTGIKLLGGPEAFHTTVIKSIKLALSRLGTKKQMQMVDEQAAMLTQLSRELNYEIGFGSKDANGNITLPSDRTDLIEISPNLTVAGFMNWTKSSYQYVHRIMAKFSKAKNAAILGYIRNGERMKAEVVTALNKAYYSQDATGQLPEAWTEHYGEIKLNPKKYQVTGLPSTSLAFKVRCEALFH